MSAFLEQIAREQAKQLIEKVTADLVATIRIYATSQEVATMTGPEALRSLATKIDAALKSQLNPVSQE